MVKSSMCCVGLMSPTKARATTLVISPSLKKYFRRAMVRGMHVGKVCIVGQGVESTATRLVLCDLPVLPRPLPRTLLPCVQTFDDSEFKITRFDTLEMEREQFPIGLDD